MKPQDRKIAERIRAILVERFPAAFAPKGGEKRPLKIGIFKAIRAELSDISENELALALEDYTWGPTYIRGLIAGAERIGLDGNPAGVVTAHEADHAASRMRMFAKAKAAKQEQPEEKP